MLHDELRPIPNEPICKKIQNYIFKFSDLLGQGNFSKVYKAHHELNNEVFAIKIIQLNSLKSKKLEELLFSQIDVLKKLSHPNILRCYEVFTSNRNCYIITEICNGGDLETRLRREHHFSEQSAQPIIKDIFSGLLYLAQCNVLHRDLKVANVFLHNGTAKIADFGFAKFTKQNFKDINIGSPIYMSPEGLIHNIYGPKTDIWAFGVLLFELLHGQTPYANCRTEQELKYKVNMPIDKTKMRVELSHEIKELILMCMEIDEARRPTAQELAQLPYIRKLMEKSPLRRMDSPVIQKKYSSSSQKFVGNGSLNQLAIQKHNFLLPREEKPQTPMPRSQDKQDYLKTVNPANVDPRRRNILRSGQQEIRGFSTDKHIVSIGRGKSNSKDFQLQSSDQLITTPQRIVDPFSSKVFSSLVTFRECVNLLHYCRLIYKYVIALKQSPYDDQTQVRTFSSWLMTLMEEIKARINENGIIYEGENAWLRQKKLREVTNQYMKKYRHELTDLSATEVTIAHALKFALDFYERVDFEANQGRDSWWLILGHYIVMILDTTNLLRCCYEKQNYSPLGAYKDLQQFLGKNRNKMDLQSYKLLRKKVSFIRQKLL